jgi:hypothetical protein
MAGVPAEATNGEPIPHPNRNDLHRELERIRKTARDVAGLSPEERRSAIETIVIFLRERFLRRTETEEAAIYPKLTRALSPDVTAPLVFDHLVIEAQTAELAAADSRDGARLQELLYGIRALIESHLERERHLYLRLLLRDEGASRESRPSSVFVR